MLSIAGSIGYANRLCDLELNFLPNRLYGITGTNGSGKSTLLRTLAGEIKPFDGTAEFDGIPVADHRSSGKVFYVSDPDFYPDMSIGEHLKLLEKTGGLLYDETVTEWNLEEYVGKSPSQISSGQRQRAFLGSQLALKARAFLLDEPERHLDSHWVATLSDVLHEKSSSGVIVLVATHSRDLLDTCTDIVELQP